jgi:hypothetical protein
MDIRTPAEHKQQPIVEFAKKHPIRVAVLAVNIIAISILSIRLSHLWKNSDLTSDANWSAYNVMKVAQDIYASTRVLTPEIIIDSSGETIYRIKIDPALGPDQVHVNPDCSISHIPTFDVAFIENGKEFHILDFVGRGTIRRDSVTRKFDESIQLFNNGIDCIAMCTQNGDGNGMVVSFSDLNDSSKAAFSNHYHNAMEIALKRLLQEKRDIRLKEPPAPQVPRKSPGDAKSIPKPTNRGSSQTVAFLTTKKAAHGNHAARLPMKMC